MKIAPFFFCCVGRSMLNCEEIGERFMDGLVHAKREFTIPLHFVERSICSQLQGLHRNLLPIKWRRKMESHACDSMEFISD